jgi:tripartite-type tricarboxylate transporter receptor subunit TctC
MAAARLVKFNVLAWQVGLVCAAIVSPPTFAQSYPVRPIKLIAPFPPGNAADVGARAMIDRLSQRLGQPVIVENRSGGAGIIGVEAVVRSQPDGYTLLATSISPVAILPAVYKKLPYDVERDLQPISMMGFLSMILVAAPNVPATTLGDLIALLKSQPGKHNFAHLGAGTISHLIAETLKVAAAVDVAAIPYKGSGAALTEMLGGQVTMMFDGMTSANAQVRAGKVKALAVTSQKRSPFASNVPTMGEAGISAMHELNMISWIGLYAPAGTPRPIIERWHKEIVAVTQLPDVKERLGFVSVEPLASESPEKFGEFQRRELQKWERIAKDAGAYQSQ